MAVGICIMIRRQCRKKTEQKVPGHRADSVFNRCGIVFEAGIADTARKIEEGAKTAVSGEIYSSFMAEADKDYLGWKAKSSKPV